MRPEALESLDERERLWRLHARYFDALKDFFERRRDPSLDAHGLAFETIVRALKKKDIEHLDHPYRYLIGIARYVHMEALREKSREERLSHRTSLAHAEVDESPSPEEILILQELRARVAEAVKKLHPPERDLYQRMMKEQTPAEIAGELRIPPAKVSVRISRLKQKLRKFVAEIEASKKMKGLQATTPYRPER